MRILAQRTRDLVVKVAGMKGILLLLALLNTTGSLPGSPSNDRKLSARLDRNPSSMQIQLPQMSTSVSYQVPQF
jgi:hypothetical protein